jgi:hypothetical protein
MVFYSSMRFLFLIVLGLVSLSSVSLADTAAMQDYPIVQLRTLDKSTARTRVIEVNVGETVQYGSLFIKVQACRESNPLEKPESASFLQVWEVPIHSDKSEWIFSGWMFASSPALSAMNHPVYDIWVIECQGGDKAQKKAKPIPSKTVTLQNETIVEPIEGTPEDSEAKIIEEVAEENDVEPTPLENTQPIDNTIESVIDDVISDSINHE